MTNLFNRSFSLGDADVFSELVEGTAGQRFSRWRETYAEGIVLDFGQLIPRFPITKSMVVQDRGEWMISSWGGDLAIRESSRQQMITAFDEIKTFLSSRVGESIRAITMNPEDLSLGIQLADDSEILFLTDRDNPDLDQWFIITPSGRSIGATASGTWYYRENSRE
jgi:hypothetical protein